MEHRHESSTERTLMPVGFMRAVLAVFLVSGLVSVL
jgi:hypothetical protein